jgi:hypothetical protein
MQSVLVGGQREPRQTIISREYGETSFRRKPQHVGIRLCYRLAGLILKVPALASVLA